MCLGLSSLAVSGAASAAPLTPGQQLGSSIFFDTRLSIAGNQACAACHGPETGWTGPNEVVNIGGGVYEGSIHGRFGNRRASSAAYATSSPILYFVTDPKTKAAVFTGGNFWDGRATGEKLGLPAADQAQGPFLNPLEQALPDSACVVYRVCQATYPVRFEVVYPGNCAIGFPGDIDARCAAGEKIALSPGDRQKSDTAYDNVARAIAAFEASPGVNAYTSKYDAFLAGKAKLTMPEKMGLMLFKHRAGCVTCHSLGPGPKGEPPLLTDYSYENLGVPRNPQNPFYEQAQFNPDGRDWVDPGLGGYLATRPEYKAYAADNLGQHRVPTLRNVDKRPHPGFVKAYMHNGYFKSLEQVVHFYNTRDEKPVCADDPATKVDESRFLHVEAAVARGCWPAPEVGVNVGTDDIGDLKLNANQEAALVAFLRTLSDGYMAP
jgi:cytochrome c peroxidase